MKIGDIGYILIHEGNDNGRNTPKGLKLPFLARMRVTSLFSGVAYGKNNANVASGPLFPTPEEAIEYYAGLCDRVANAFHAKMQEQRAAADRLRALKDTEIAVFDAAGA